MKRLIVLMMALVMLLTLAACGSKETTGFVGKSAEIANHKITITGAKFYKPYETSSGTILLYFDFTNNTDEETSAMKGVYWTAKQNGETCNGMDFLEEDRPEMYNSGYTKIAPGETTQCMEVVDVYADDAGPVEITFADMYHEDETTLVVSIDPATLEEYTK